MTSRQRLLALLRGEPTDRIGLHVMGVRPYTPWWVAKHNATYRPLIEVVREKTDIIDGIGFDVGFYYTAAPLQIDRTTEPLPGQPDIERHITVIHAPHGPLTAVEYVHRQVQIPMPHEHFLKTLDDVENFFAIPYVPLRPDIAPFIARDRILGERGLMLIGLGSDPIGDVHDLVGSELLALWSVEHRDVLHRLLAEFLRRKLDVIHHFNASGLHRQMPVLFGHSGAEIVVPPLHGPADFREFCAAYDRPLHAAIHEAGGYIRVHCHGSLRAILEDFVAAGVDMLQPIECPPEGDTPLAEAKRRIGDKLVIEGNIQFTRLCNNSPEDFRHLVSQTVADGKPGGRFILCPTASPYHVDLPENVLRNYLIMIETALSEGSYG